MERRRKRLLGRVRQEQARAQAQPEKQRQPEERSLHFDDPASAAAEKGLIRLLYLEPELSRKSSLPAPEEFSSQALAHMYTVLLEKARRGEHLSTATLGDALSGAEMSLLVQLLQEPEVLSRGEKTLQDYIDRIREQRERKNDAEDLRQLSQKLREKKGYKG